MAEFFGHSLIWACLLHPPKAIQLQSQNLIQTFPSFSSPHITRLQNFQLNSDTFQSSHHIPSHQLVWRRKEISRLAHEAKRENRWIEADRNLSGYETPRKDETTLRLISAIITWCSLIFSFCGTLFPKILLRTGLFVLHCRNDSLNEAVSQPLLTISADISSSSSHKVQV